MVREIMRDQFFLSRKSIPATPDDLADALNECGAASWDEVVFQAEDSAIPLILDELDCESIEEINDLAQAIQYRAGRSELTKLKAVLHAADCRSIHTATYIAQNLDDYLYQEECAPTLKGAESGTNMVPSILCLNDQGGKVMECSEDVSGTLRAQEHGHQPLIYENHGIDSRYTGPLNVTPTMSARYGTGGNNVPLVEKEPVFCITGNAIARQPQNGGNGIGYQADLAYTLTATDHHAGFSRQRVDVFKGAMWSAPRAHDSIRMQPIWSSTLTWPGWIVETAARTEPCAVHFRKEPQAVLSTLSIPYETVCSSVA